ncbi:arginase-1-like isoform X4 [Dermacentor silvarum]|uniref:arginase-1-like isoform X4 n=1 Tax=Dermacentor silvarum TaxID=543639 RepID=UPI0021010ABB|nr:arginase-1-like isoform X4 [Dermacentor silvarum]
MKKGPTTTRRRRSTSRAAGERLVFSEFPYIKVSATRASKRVHSSCATLDSSTSSEISVTKSRTSGDVRVEGETNVTDCGAIESDVVGQTNKNVRDAVANVLRSGRLSLNLGGDHIMSIGSVIGHAQSTDSEVALIWIDAHGDINTPNSSTSGNIHGMPLSFLVHEMAPFVVKPKGLEWVQPCVRKDNLAYIGLRDVDPYERYFMGRLGIRTYDMGDVDRLGIRGVVQRILREINPTGDKSLHISYDIDVIDKLIAPSTGTPVLGGLTLREALVIAEEVSKSGQLRVLDLAEVNPLLGDEQDASNTVDCGVKLVDAFFGSPRGGHLPLDLDANIVDPNCESCASETGATA